MKLSEDTLKLMTPEQKESLPRLLSRFEHQFEFIRGSNGEAHVRVYEGVKYVVHASYAMFIDPAFVPVVAEKMGADGFFTGKICGKDETVFFFMPLFE